MRTYMHLHLCTQSTSAVGRLTFLPKEREAQFGWLLEVLGDCEMPLGLPASACAQRFTGTTVGAAFHACWETVYIFAYGGLVVEIST